MSNLLEADWYVISCVAEDPKNWALVGSKLEANDFTDHRTKSIWQVAKELEEKEIRLSFPVWNEHIEARFTVQLSDYFIEIAADYRGNSQLEKYADYLIAKARERELNHAGKVISEQSSAALSLPQKIANAQELIMKVGSSAELHNAEHISVPLDRYLKELAARSENGDKFQGLATGFSNIDYLLKGLRPGNLVLLAARPSCGKTTLALNICSHAAKAGNNVFVFSLEMSSEEVVEKMVSQLSGVEHEKLLSGAAMHNTNEAEAVSTVSNVINRMPLNINSFPSATMDMIRTQCLRESMDRKVDLVMIDYLQLVADPGKSIYERVTNVSRNCKILAKELECPVIALSQLNRQVDSRAYPDNRPRLSDLRESGALEQDADIIAFLYRDILYNEHTLEPHAAELNVEKFRMGQKGRIYLKEEFHLSRFQDYQGIPEYGAEPKQKKVRTFE